MRVCAPCSRDLAPPAEACLVDGFRLGPTAPAHRAVVDGDTKSAAIAAASIVAKVTRDRVMRRLDALYPRYGFASHVGYITPGHSAAVREHGPCEQHRLSFNALCVRRSQPRLNDGRARAARHYRLRGYRILGANVWAGGNELDLIVRRGRRLVFCEVKGKTGDGFGEPLEMVDEEKLRRMRRAADGVARAQPGAAWPRLPLRGRRGAARQLERVAV